MCYAFDVSGFLKGVSGVSGWRGPPAPSPQRAGAGLPRLRAAPGAGKLPGDRRPAAPGAGAEIGRAAAAVQEPVDRRRHKLSHALHRMTFTQ